jgi:hypothetical protein
MMLESQVSRSQHFVTLFDSEGSRAASVAAFVLHARGRQEPVAILATGEHWEQILRAAGKHAADFSRGLAEGTLAFADAEIALFEISRGGLPDRSRFDGHVRNLLRTLPDGRVNIYGELVDILAARDEFDAVVRLEELWNEILACESIQLMCGYDATVFAPQGAASHLRAVCGCHTETRVSADDALGRWLLSEADVEFAV